MLPSVAIRKMPEVLGVRSVTPVIVSNHSDAASRSQIGEALITAVVLPKPVKNLNYGNHISIALPAITMNDVPVFCV